MKVTRLLLANNIRGYAGLTKNKSEYFTAKEADQVLEFLGKKNFKFLGDVKCPRNFTLNTLKKLTAEVMKKTTATDVKTKARKEENTIKDLTGDVNKMKRFIVNKDETIKTLREKINTLEAKLASTEETTFSDDFVTVIASLPQGMLDTAQNINIDRKFRYNYNTRTQQKTPQTEWNVSINFVRDVKE